MTTIRWIILVLVIPVLTVLALWIAVNVGDEVSEIDEIVSIQ